VENFCDDMTYIYAHIYIHLDIAFKFFLKKKVCGKAHPNKIKLQGGKGIKEFVFSYVQKQAVKNIHFFAVKSQSLHVKN